MLFFILKNHEFPSLENRQKQTTYLNFSQFWMIITTTSHQSLFSLISHELFSTYTQPYRFCYTPPYVNAMWNWILRTISCLFIMKVSFDNLMASHFLTSNLYTHLVTSSLYWAVACKFFFLDLIKLPHYSRGRGWFSLLSFFFNLLLLLIFFTGKYINIHPHNRHEVISNCAKATNWSYWSLPSALKPAIDPEAVSDASLLELSELLIQLIQIPITI